MCQLMLEIQKLHSLVGVPQSLPSQQHQMQSPAGPQARSPSRIPHQRLGMATCIAEEAASMQQNVTPAKRSRQEAARLGSEKVMRVEGAARASGSAPSHMTHACPTSFIYLVIHSFICSCICSFLHSCICSFMHLFIPSFIHVFTLVHATLGTRSPALQDHEASQKSITPQGVPQPTRGSSGKKRTLVGWTLLNCNLLSWLCCRLVWKERVNRLQPRSCSSGMW